MAFAENFLDVPTMNLDCNSSGGDELESQKRGLSLLFENSSMFEDDGDFSKEGLEKALTLLDLLWGIFLPNSSVSFSFAEEMVVEEAPKFPLFEVDLKAETAIFLTIETRRREPKSLKSQKFNIRLKEQEIGDEKRQNFTNPEDKNPGGKKKKKARAGKQQNK